MKEKIVRIIAHGNMTGRFFIGENSYLQIEDISKNSMICSFHSLLDYRVIGDIDNPDALDPSGGPFIAKGDFNINGFTLNDIKWNNDTKVYLLEFRR